MTSPSSIIGSLSASSSCSHLRSSAMLNWLFRKRGPCVRQSTLVQHSGRAREWCTVGGFGPFCPSRICSGTCFRGSNGSMRNNDCVSEDPDAALDLERVSLGRNSNSTRWKSLRLSHLAKSPLNPEVVLRIPDLLPRCLSQTSSDFVYSRVIIKYVPKCKQQRSPQPDCRW